MHRLLKLVIGFLGLAFATSGALMLIRFLAISSLSNPWRIVEGAARILFGGVTVAWALRRSAKTSADSLSELT
jgi:hypothetical protein